MRPSLQDFNRGLYEEHLEDISFLYEQRRALLGRPEFPWTQLVTFEGRLEAHLDALLIGGDAAQAVCRSAEQAEDYGKIFGALCVYCRKREVASLSATLATMDLDNPRQVFALTDALKWELPREWHPFVVRALARADRRLAPILAEVCGYVRVEGAELMLSDWLSDESPQLRQLVEALGRYRFRPAEVQISRYQSHPDANVREAAALTVLRCGSIESIRSSMVLAPPPTRSCMAQALACGRESTSGLLRPIRDGQATAKDVLAVGLLGDPTTLRQLYELLDIPHLAASAAQALQCMTGADLYEDVHVPEDVDEASLFSSELQAWRQYKEAPTRGDGRLYGEDVRLVSTDKETWRSWFAENGVRFDPAVRYRSGQPVCPRTLLNDLASPSASRILRQHSALELEIRYGCDVVFELDMWVGRQRAALHQIAAWVTRNEERFESGRWYLRGVAQ